MASSTVISGCSARRIVGLGRPAGPAGAGRRPVRPRPPSPCCRQDPQRGAAPCAGPRPGWPLVRPGAGAGCAGRLLAPGRFGPGQAWPPFQATPAAGPPRVPAAAARSGGCPARLGQPPAEHHGGEQPGQGRPEERVAAGRPGRNAAMPGTSASSSTQATVRQGANHRPSGPACATSAATTGKASRRVVRLRTRHAPGSRPATSPRARPRTAVARPSGGRGHTAYGAKISGAEQKPSRTAARERTTAR